MGRYSYTRAIEMLSEYALREGYAILLDHDGGSMIKWNNKTLNEPEKIGIDKNPPIELRTYEFLHELGHHELRKNWDKFKKVLPITAEAEKEQIRSGEVKYKRRLIYNVSCMEEEFKAWDEGYKLGKKLGIRISDKKWYEYKSKCLMTYMRYYSGKKI